MELIITSENFSKSAKRLQKNNKNESLSLSQSKEILAKSLGFRNYDAIQKYFSKESYTAVTKNTDNLSPQKEFISHLNEEQLIILFSMGLNHDEGSQRARILCNSIFPYLCYIREHEGVDLTLSLIKKNITYSELNKTSKRSDIPEQIQQNVKNYLYSLPGYTDTIPSMVSLDVHNDTLMKLSPSFLLFDKIENNRVILIPDFILVLLIKNSIEWRNPARYISKLSEWEYFESSSFFEDNIVELIKSQSSKIHGSLHLHELLLLSLNYINYDKRKQLFNIVNDLAGNLSVVKEISQSLIQFKI